MSTRDELGWLIEELADEEREVLLFIARRLRQGQDDYGKLDLAHDKRDLQREQAEEIADFLIYEGMRFVKRAVSS